MTPTSDIKGTLAHHYDPVRVSHQSKGDYQKYVLHRPSMDIIVWQSPENRFKCAISMQNYAKKAGPISGIDTTIARIDEMIEEAHG